MYVKQENPTKRKQILLKKRNFIKKKKNVTKIPLILMRFFGFSEDVAQICRN